MATGRIPTTSSSADELAFIRRRVGLVSGVMAGIAFLATLGGLSEPVFGLPGQFGERSLVYSLVAMLCFGAVTLACFTMPLGRQTLALVETIGFVGWSGAP
jgi:hypothetical protein